MMKVAIFIAGFLGASARYGLGLLWPAGTGGGAGLSAAMPWTTLAINLSGSLLLGLLIGGAAAGGRWPEWAREAAGTGFLGAYTTFSAFQAELWQLLSHNHFATAAAYMLLSGVGGWLLALTGLTLGNRREGAGR